MQNQCHILQKSGFSSELKVQGSDGPLTVDMVCRSGLLTRRKPDRQRVHLLRGIRHHEINLQTESNALMGSGVAVLVNNTASLRDGRRTLKTPLHVSITVKSPENGAQAVDFFALNTNLLGFKLAK